MILALLTAGCANETHYPAYLDATKEAGDREALAFAAHAAAYYRAAAEPLVDITLPGPDGQVYQIRVARDVQPLPTPRTTVEQVRANEWVPVAAMGLGAVAGVAGQWVQGDTTVRTIKAISGMGVGAGTTYNLSDEASVAVSDSYNRTESHVHGEGNTVTQQGRGDETAKAAPAAAAPAGECVPVVGHHCYPTGCSDGSGGCINATTGEPFWPSH
jgi:hypothetical protein